MRCNSVYVSKISVYKKKKFVHRKQRNNTIKCLKIQRKQLRRSENTVILNILLCYTKDRRPSINQCLFYFVFWSNQNIKYLKKNTIKRSNKKKDTSTNSQLSKAEEESEEGISERLKKQQKLETFEMDCMAIPSIIK
ncbi:hypothetical protein RFI_20671 [Reticulomyxa filosa]|uniref:Uncharacterized protein n=1 Tax=Reticulomyxa filosa TaxID=46433 RepID=X6MRM7_RETFI|nr:hypothetical protein RFI_20671 [Reticulomyxa filosa]|eukprot:ETO16668.1 hypothetical protein RFI_20671 [Reticulomyxa filosa]